MAAKPVRFHEDADAECEDAFDWYLARSPHAAAEFAAELSRAVELIARAPRRWASGLRRRHRRNHGAAPGHDPCAAAPSAAIRAKRTREAGTACCSNRDKEESSNCRSASTRTKLQADVRGALRLPR